MDIGQPGGDYQIHFKSRKYIISSRLRTTIKVKIASKDKKYFVNCLNIWRLSR